MYQYDLVCPCTKGFVPIQSDSLLFTGCTINFRGQPLVVVEIMGISVMAVDIKQGIHVYEEEAHELN